MLLNDADNSNRTERPTARRLRQARERGLVARSTELLVAARIVAIWLVLTVWVRQFVNSSAQFLEATIRSVNDKPLTTNTMIPQVQQAAWNSLAQLLWPSIIVVVTLMMSHFGQVRWLWTPSRILPDWSRLSPLANWTQRFGAAAFGRGIILLGKLTVVLTISWSVLSKDWPSLWGHSPTLTTESSWPPILSPLKMTTSHLVSQVALGLLAWGVVDYLWQRRRLQQSLRMTRDELKQELKELEGDPLIKQRLRQSTRQ